MRHISIIPAALYIAALSTPVIAQDANDIPDLARAMMQAAAETGDPAEIAAVGRAVSKVFPDFEAGIASYQEELITSIPTETKVADAEAVEAPENEEEESAVTSEAPPQDGLWRLGAWSGSLNAGATLASGNSDNIATGLAIDASRVLGRYTHNITAGIDIGASAPAATTAVPDPERVLTQKRWYGAYKLDIAFSERTYAYTRIAYEEDQFSGFDYRIFGGAGIGRFLYKSTPFTWAVEGGPGYRFSPIDDTRETESEAAFYASSKIDWLIREGLLFEQDNDVTWTSPTTTITSYSALTTSLTDYISTGLSVNIRYETNPPLGRENLDTLIKASVKYGF